MKQPVFPNAAVAVVVFASLALAANVPATYLIGPGDEIAVNVSNVNELNGRRTYRVDPQGNVDMPMVGTLHVSGQAVTEIRAEIVVSLKAYVYEPQVSVEISQFGSQAVSILGAVNEPGVHQLEGRKSLLEVLAMAKGLRADASNDVHITRQAQRGGIPVPNARLDESRGFYTANINIKSLIEAKDPQSNISIQPDDVVTVSLADLVYVVGAVTRPGGFPLNQRRDISALQALSLAGGFSEKASAKKARIIRPTGDKDPQEIPKLTLKRFWPEKRETSI